ncbi:MAG: Gfo/Idh/MocA family protein, partial [Blautia producta]
MKTRFIIIGFGWRADFFYRIAKMMPERFEISAGVLRTKQRAEEVAEKEGVYATENLDEALKTNPDFAVLCVPRTIVKEYLVRLMEAGLPILCETPPAQNVKELCELWEETKRLKGRVQIIEQYFLQPYYAASLEIIRKGFLGETTGVMLSALHGYHAVSMFRKYLGIGFENCRIRGQKFISDITATNGREGFDQSGKKVQFERDWASIAFDNGKTAFLDFAGEQYFSMI